MSSFRRGTLPTMLNPTRNPTRSAEASPRHARAGASSSGVEQRLADRDERVARERNPGGAFGLGPLAARGSQRRL